MAVTNVLNILRHSIGAFSAGDMEGFLAIWADDATYTEIATQRKVRGKKAIGEIFHGWRQAFPDATGTVINMFAHGSRGVAEILWQGTHTGIMRSGQGSIPPTQKSAQVRAVFIINTTGSTITECTHYSDLMSLLQQLDLD